MDISNVFIIFLCVIFLYILGKIFAIPIKAIFKLILNSCIGGILIFIVNLIGNIFNFHLGLNIITSIIVGILGIPRSFSFNYFKINYVKIKKITKKVQSNINN